MTNIKDLSLFIALSWVLIITPGPDLVYVLTRGISLGRKAGLISAVGVTMGILVHTLFAALGLSIILKTSALAFMIVKYFGAAYLIYLGIKAIVQSNKLELNQTEQINQSKLFLQGFISNTLNPKVALFFMAFLPQFIVVQGGQSSAVGFILLGLLFAFFGLLFLAFLGFFSGYIGTYLKKNSKFSSRIQSISGLVMIVLGARLAFLRRH